MLKKLLMLCVAFMLSIGAAFAAVDVNTADQAALESVKGLGPVKSKAIIDERTKNGPFKDADDLANRVKGLGTKSVGHLEENGLTIGGSSTPPKGVKLSKPAATTSATPSATTSAGTASTPTTTTTGTTATAPAASAPEAAAKPAKSKRASKKEKAAAAAAASADAGASAPAAASSTKATKGSKKKSKKDKAASAAAASGA